jgi:hypothetical protein
MDTTIEQARPCERGAPRQRHSFTASRYRVALVRAMAHAEPSVPARRSASIADRHAPRVMN